MNHPSGTIALLRCGIALAGFAYPLSGQTALPATAPTTVTPSQLPSANPQTSGSAADVQWDGQLLRISASGASLAEVLSQIAARAGMRMSGSPPADRIYGTYGPAPLQDVLSDLVTGLPVNMLFVERAGTIPARLTFTARIGGPTPAQPGQSLAQQQQQPAEAYPAIQQQPASGVAANPGFASSTGGSTGVSSTTAEPPATASQPADGSGNPTSPNGVKTPQEIFEQLQRMRATSTTPH